LIKEKLNGDIARSKRKTWGYISKKDELKENCFWDDWMLNAIEVYSETEITNDQAQQIQEWGLA
jgi:hypothetical protein